MISFSHLYRHGKVKEFALFIFACAFYDHAHEGRGKREFQIFVIRAAQNLQQIFAGEAYHQVGALFFYRNLIENIAVYRSCAEVEHLTVEIEFYYTLCLTCYFIFRDKGSTGKCLFKICLGKGNESFSLFRDDSVVFYIERIYQAGLNDICSLLSADLKIKGDNDIFSCEVKMNNLVCIFKQAEQFVYRAQRENKTYFCFARFGINICIYGKLADSKAEGITGDSLEFISRHFKIKTCESRTAVIA